MITGHLGQLHAGNSLEYISRLFVDIVVSAEETGIMVCEQTVNRFLQFEFALSDKVGDYFRVVIDLKIATKMRVVLFDGIISVRTGADNFFHSILVHCVYVHLRQCLREIFISTSHGGIAAATLFFTQDTEIDTGLLQESGKGYSNFLTPIIKGTGAAYIIEILYIRVFGQCLDAQLFGPVSSHVSPYSPGVRVVLHISVSQLQFRREISLHQHLVLPHACYHRNMLIEYGANLHTGHAVCARPQFVEIYNLAHHYFFRFRYRGFFPLFGGILRGHHNRHPFQPVFLNILMQLLRRKGLARQISGTHILTSSTPQARVGIKNLLPCKILKLPDTKRLRIFKVGNGFKISRRFQRFHILVGRSKDNVYQL